MKKYYKTIKIWLHNMKLRKLLFLTLETFQKDTQNGRCYTKQRITRFEQINISKHSSTDVYGSIFLPWNKNVK